MLDVSEITEEFGSRGVSGEFSATPVDVEQDPFPESNIDREIEESESMVKDSKIRIQSLSFRKPKHPVIAIDGTSYVLGKSQNGAVGGIRVAIVESNNGKMDLQKYGPFLLNINSKNKDDIYNSIRHKLFRKRERKPAPTPEKTIDRMRSFLEKYLQLKLSQRRKNRLLLFDGSLIEGTVDSPTGFVNKVLSNASENNNDVIGVTKRTSLVLESNDESILSLLSGLEGPRAAHVTPHIKQTKNKYAGNIYVVKLAPTADGFRLDISSKRNDFEVLEELTGLCGGFGYPEELRVAHVHCKFSAVELIELQAAAIDAFNIEFSDNLRRKLFGPWE